MTLATARANFNKLCHKLQAKAVRLLVGGCLSSGERARDFSFSSSSYMFRFLRRKIKTKKLTRPLFSKKKN